MRGSLNIALLVTFVFWLPTSRASQEDVGVFVESPSPSPTGAQVVFAANFDGPINLWIIGTNGQQLRKLTYNALTDRDPGWSPDGKVIVFASTSGTFSDIWSIQPDGTHIKQLTSKAFSNKQPAWSPDGTQIVFVSDRGGTNDIWIMNSDGTGAKRITRLPGEEDHPAFSPSGNQIVFSETVIDSSATLMTINVDGSGLTSLTTVNGKSSDWNSQWSLNGILFSSNRGDLQDHWKIWTVQPNGSGLKQIGTAPAVDPVLLSDGRVVFSDAFSTQASATVTSELTLLDPVSGSKQLITSVSKFLPDEDVNNDGLVNCSDLTALRPLYGKRLGQVGFNLRADTNHDGVIDIRDLAFISRKLPKGLTCN